MQADRGAGDPASSGVDKRSDPEDFKKEEDRRVPEADHPRSEIR